MYQHIIWDFDGTLFDTYDVMTKAMSLTLEEEGHPHSYEEIYGRLKVAVSQTIKYYQETYNLSPNFKENYVTRRKSIEVDQCRPFPDAFTILKSLMDSGKKQYIFTHRGPTIYHFFEKYSLSKYFTHVITSKDPFEKKPSPDAIQYLIKQYQISPEEVIMIGDRELDILAGANANIDTCFFDDQGEICSNATYSIKALKELYSIL